MREDGDDLQIINKFRGGEKSLFEDLVLKHQDKIYNLCRHMLDNAHDAEDAAQDTFIKAYQNLDNFKPNASFYTWLYRIGVNTCLDYKKRPFWESLLRRSDDEEEYNLDPASSEPSPEKIYESKQLGLVLRKGLSRLSAKLRAVIVLKEIEGLSYEEIAEVLNVSTGTVKSRLSRAREKLKSQLKKFREQN